jgi:hypothetical protein
MISLTWILKFAANNHGVSFTYARMLWDSKRPVSSVAAKAVMRDVQKCLKAKETFERTIGLRSA